MHNPTKEKRSIFFRFVTIYSLISILFQSLLPFFYVFPKMAQAQEITPTVAPTPTSNPTEVPTLVPTPELSITPTISPTAEPTPTAEITPTPTGSITPTNEPTLIPTATPTTTAEAQITPEVTLIITPTPTQGEILDGISTDSANFSEAKLNLAPREKILIHEKLNKGKLTKSRKKLSSDLLRLIDNSFLSINQNRAQLLVQMKGLKQYIGSGDSVNSVDKRIENKKHSELVHIYVNVNNEYPTSAIDSLAWKVVNRDEKNHIVVILAEVDKLDSLISLDAVKSINTVQPPVVQSGSVVTQGDIIHKTDKIRSMYSQSGAGIKIGVISDGVDNMSSAKSSGDLPLDVTVLSNSEGGDEGTAMLEIIHDMVPSSKLFFHDCGSNILAFNSAIDDLVSAGVNVIVDDISWTSEPYFEDGTIAKHVASVLANNNIIYISSAGNDASDHFQGDFYNDGSNFNDFSSGTSINKSLYVNIPNNGTVIVNLQWNDSFGQSSNDYDLFLFNLDNGQLLSVSENIQNGNDNPSESIIYTNTTGSTIDAEIDINKYIGNTKTLEVFIRNINGTSHYSNNLTSADSIFGHKAVPGVIAVGAISADDPGNDTIESFSSQGPVTIIGQGQRSKPDVAGIDCVAVTGAGGFSTRFCGTSAAAPHIAAIAAQLWGKVPMLTSNQIKNYILNNAVDLGSLGNDYVFGHGRADALLAYNSLLANSTKAITSFTIPSQVGESIIDETAHTIGVTMPFGTNVTALIPTISHTGSSISPASGVAGNFSSPKTYTVTAADSSTQAYTVTVSLTEDPVAAAFDDISANLAASPNNVANNLNDVTSANVSSFAGLSFEKSINGVPVGKLTFSSALNLSSTETQTFLQNLGTKLEQGNGRIALDARDSAVFSATGATLTMYGFTDDISQSQLIVRDDANVVLNQTGLISGFTQDPTTHNITFSTAHFTQFDIDTTKPVIASHSNIGPIEATSASGATATYTAPTATDNIDASAPATCSPLSGTTFALGQTTITCNKTDTAGNAATPTTFTVTVVDTTKPVIAAHANITTLATSPSGASVTYTAPLATDNVDTTSAASCTPTSGSTFPIGDTTVTCTKTDTAGNSAIPTTFTVTVNKNPPVLDAIGNKTVNELTNLTFTAHATDVDSTPTYSLTNAPTGATIDSSTGVFSFTPTEAQGPGTYSVTISATDGTSTDSEDITITVNEVNTAPVADAISTSTNEDTAKVITLTSTDSDLPVNTITYSKVTDPTHGTVSISGNQATYTPNENYNGSDSFTYRANDSTANSNTATVSITITAVNDSPSITSVAPTPAVEDTIYTYNASISDVDGPTPTWSIASSDTCGGVITSDTGVYTFTPAGPIPPASCVIGIKVSDNGTPNLSATQSTTISITAVNDLPVSAADSYSTKEDETLTVATPGVLTNDSDPDNVNITAVLVSNVSHGTLTLNTNGSFSYTPGANYNGSDSFTYKATDGESDSNTTTVTITITPVNDAPVAVANSYTGNEDVVMTIENLLLLANDTDVDGDILTIQSVSNPIHGTVELDNLDPNGKKVIFTPSANFNGTASFDYTISDGTLTSTATVTITYNPVNDAPVLATIGNKSIDEFATLTTTVNATDVDNASLTYTTSALPENATFDAATRTFTFTPVESQGGNTYNVTFTVSDGNLSDSETISIQVNEVNSAPVAVNDSTSINEDGELTLNTTSLLSNDYDLDTNTNAGLTITAVNSAVNGTVSLSGSTITFAPNTNFYGSAPFKYIVSDGSLTDTGTVNVTVNAVNDAPILDAIGNKNVDEFSTLTIVAHATDVDNETITYATSTLPANATFNAATKTFTFTPDESQGGSTYNVTFTVSDGSLTDSETIEVAVNEVNNAPIATADTATMNEDSVLTINTSTLLANDKDLDTNTNVGLSISEVNTSINGVVIISGNTITFTPNLNFNGTASFNYVVTDGSLTDIGHVSITVNAVNDVPVANDGSITTAEDTVVEIALSGTDIDGDNLTYAIVSTVSHGTLGDVVGNKVTYTPTLNYNGPASFTFKTNDGILDSDTATVRITETAVNDAPVLDIIGSKSINELTNLSFTAHATDVDSTPTYSLTNAPTGATIDSSTGVFSFTPTEAQGPGTYNMTVSATDGTSTDSEEITITVNEVNVPPIVQDVDITTAEDTIKIITLSGSDSDIPANTLTYSKVDGPAHGTVAITGNKVTYTPSTDYNGTDSFTYKTNDGLMDSVAATVMITITPVNDAPVAVANSYTANEDTVMTLENSLLLTNDTDVDGDILTIHSVSNPIHGTVELDNFDPNGKKVIFTPTDNFNGTASFDYTITDGTLTSTATVTITYNPVNDAPVASNSSITASQDTATEITLTGDDVDSDILSYSIVSNPIHGSLGEMSNNKIVYTPNTSYTGADSFTYKANDGAVDSNVATVSITVNPPPVISDLLHSTPGTSSLTITWTTDHSSTSRVVYDTIPHFELGEAPNYSYAFSTVETDNTPKVTSHTVTLSGLSPGTTYYYRSVSHGSPETVSTENSFTTAKETTNSDNSSNNSSSNSSNTSNSTAPICNDQKPGSAPLLLSAVAGFNSVTLTWSKSSDPVSYYLVTYGTSSGSQAYGNPNVGSSSTTSYTVTGLSGGTTYYFRVRAGNGCMPGDYSNERSTTPSGGFIAGVAPGFEEGVLGEMTSAKEESISKNSKQIGDTNTDNILGVETNQTKKSNYNYIIASLLLVVIVGGVTIYLKRRKNS